MTPESEADRLNLRYIGYEFELYWFNDLITESTITVSELGELEDRVNKSRRKFKDADKRRT